MTGQVPRRDSFGMLDVLMVAFTAVAGIDRYVSGRGTMN
jgi:hypothetical protein